MRQEKLPQFEALVTVPEFRHIQAFPTTLRLVKGTSFLEDLWDIGLGHAGPFGGLEMQRALDGATISLTMEEVWEHMNLHLIHVLDFLPVAGWNVSASDVFLQEFAAMHTLLERAGQLRAQVSLPEEFKVYPTDPSRPSVWDQVELGAGPSDPEAGLPGDFLATVLRAVPKKIMRALGMKQVEEFCADGGVSLEYRWLPAGGNPQETAGI